MEDLVVSVSIRNRGCRPRRRRGCLASGRERRMSGRTVSAAPAAARRQHPTRPKMHRKLPLQRRRSGSAPAGRAARCGRQKHRWGSGLARRGRTTRPTGVHKHIRASTGPRTG
jgi:hypothetical protein